jgi:site-specific DNA-methyltransferase (adenine-specific)
MNENVTKDLEINSITFNDRKLSIEEQEDVDQLVASIKTLGLLHPVTVEQNDGNYTLMTGLKRLKACRIAGMGIISCLIIPAGLADNDKKRIHLHENLFRFNLPWWETVILEKELLELRQAEKGKGVQGRKVGYSLRDLAEELGKGLGTLSEDMRLADAVMANPNLRKIDDKITAKRLILREAKRIDAEAEAGLVTSVDFNTVYHGNSVEILKQLPSNSFDACITDPPWLEFKIENLRKDDQTLLVFEQLGRVLKQESFLYAFVSTDDFYIYRKELPGFGFKVAQMPLIWVKQNHISHGLRGYDYARDYEPILLAVKGSPVLVNRLQSSSVFTYPLVHPSKAIHPNEKPLALIEQLLSHCSYDGSMIIEPFGGSGVLGEAARNMDRRYVIIERDKQYYDGIVQRLAKMGKSSGLNLDTLDILEREALEE